MKLTRDELIRITLIFFGIFFICFGIYQLYSLFSDFTSKFLEINVDFFKRYSEFLSYIFINKLEVVVFLVLGIILFYLGYEWKRFFLFLSKTFISISIFFLFFGVFLFVINSNSGEISKTIQPSLDYIIIDVVNKNLKESLIQPDKKFVEFLYYKNPRIYDFYTDNLTIEQANFLLENLGFDNLFQNDNSKILFSKIIITQINKNYFSLIGNNLPKGVEIPVPFSILKENSKLLNSFDLNLDFIFYLTESEIINLGLIEKDTRIKILYSNFTEYVNFSFENPSEDSINKFLYSLNIDSNISIESKKFYSQILFINLLKILKSYDINEELINKIPLNIISFLIPKEYFSLFDYDLFSNNYKNNAKELYRIRSDCDLSKLKINEFCQYVNITRYDNLILFLEGNYSNNISENINFNNINNSFIKEMPNDFKTINAIQNKIEKKSENYFNYLLIFILLIILSVFSYIIHYKYISKENWKIIDLFYFVFEKLFLNFLFAVIPFGIFYYFIKSEVFFTFLKSQILLFFPENGEVIFDLITNLESFKILFEILGQIFDIYFYIFIFLFLVFILLLLYKFSLKSNKILLNN
jgi:hypothetical protein